MHRMGVYLGLVEDEDDYAEGSDGYGHREHAVEHPVERAPRREPAYAGRGREAEPAHIERAPRREYEREYDAVDTRYSEPLVAQPTYQITALHPRTYNEARTIGEQFRKNTPVIMNLSEMDDADAKRLVDFAAGLTFGLHGRIERVTAKVFLLSPHNVTVTAQDKAKIVENGFFNQS